MNPAPLPGGLDLDRLPRTSVAELRRLWAEHVGPRTPPPLQRRVLIRELSWRVQERLHGGLDAETQRLLKAAVGAATAWLRERAVTAESGSAPHPRTAKGPAPARRIRTRRPPAARGLSTASRLLRTWRGRTHEVEVLVEGTRFRYRGKEFKSLSEIARLITGTRWSGPRFFGLVNRRRPGEDQST